MVRVQYVKLVRDRVEKLQEGYEGESWRFRQHKSHLSLFFSYVCFSFPDHESAPYYNPFFSKIPDVST